MELKASQIGSIPLIRPRGQVILVRCVVAIRLGRAIQSIHDARNSDRTRLTQLAASSTGRRSFGYRRTTHDVAP